MIQVILFKRHHCNYVHLELYEFICNIILIKFTIQFQVRVEVQSNTDFYS